jgi:hypothetical protein
MRTLFAAALCATLFVPLPAIADDKKPQGQMVVLKASQIGQVFCLSRTGNDEALISGILTANLNKAIADAKAKDDAFAKKYPDEKPPLGDGLGWQSTPDYADSCAVGLVTLSKTDAKVEIKYGFKDSPDANYTDTLILKKVPIDGMDVGYWRIDDLVYPDGTDMKQSLIDAFANAD